MSERGQLPGRALFGAGLVLVTFLVSAYALMNQNYGLMAGMLFAAPAVALIGNPPVWIPIIAGLSQSWLLIPGLPGGIELFYYFCGAFGMLILARTVILKQQAPPMPLSFLFLLIFLGWLGIIISQRGFGLLSAGGQAIGGTAYVKIAATAVFLYASRYIYLPPRYWRIAAILMILGALVPAIAQMMYIVSGGKLEFQYNFVAFYSGTEESLKNTFSGGVVRFTFLATVAMSATMATLIFTTRRASISWRTAVLLMVSLAIGLLSGFRSAILSFVGITTIYLIMHAPKGRKMPRVLAFGLLGFVMLCLAVALASVLPLAVQRALSWIPFAHVDAMAASEARESTLWRIELWRYCWERVPDYLFIGRGFTIDLDDLLLYSVRQHRIYRYWADHNYHNGPLSLLLDTGLTGTILMILFMVFSTFEVMRGKFTVGDNFVYRFLQYMRATYLFSIISFWLFFGDIRSSLPMLCFQLAMIHSLKATSQNMERAKVDRPRNYLDPSFGASFTD